MSANTVTLTVARYAALLRKEAMLRALQSGGVDNWEWYSESLDNAGYFDDCDNEKFIKDAQWLADEQAKE